MSNKLSGLYENLLGNELSGYHCRWEKKKLEKENQNLDYQSFWGAIGT